MLTVLTLSGFSLVILAAMTCPLGRGWMEGLDGGVGEVDRTVPPSVHIIQLSDVLQTVQGQTHGDLSWKSVNSIPVYFFNITLH